MFYYVMRMNELMVPIEEKLNRKRKRGEKRKLIKKKKDIGKINAVESFRKCPG